MKQYSIRRGMNAGFEIVRTQRHPDGSTATAVVAQRNTRPEASKLVETLEAAAAATLASAIWEDTQDRVVWACKKGTNKV